MNVTSFPVNFFLSDTYFSFSFKCVKLVVGVPGGASPRRPSAIGCQQVNPDKSGHLSDEGGRFWCGGVINTRDRGMSRRLLQSQDLTWSSRRAVEIGREEAQWACFFFPFLESKQSILSLCLGPVTAEWLKVAGRSFSSTNTHRRWRPKETSHTYRSRNTQWCRQRLLNYC